MDSQMHE
jgi:hypothetical protein